MQPSVSSVSADELQRIGLFGALSSEALQHLSANLTVVTPGSGEVIFSEGETASEFYVLLEGEVEVVKQSKTGVDARVALLGVGDWFGEMSVIDVQPRSATVRALAPSRLLKIRAADLDALYRFDLKAYALVVLNIARELSRRLRVTDGILADFVTSLVPTYVARRRRP
ncbi:MAG: cyclic nucleotide-binding domain-containing protein [Polyangiaceae bacterium]|nr:cyclic nucleotide-binding domain-containing protein [Polyangiaceae bacterium]MCW5790060.1 cyclic nucleotide-binding domain-containing protein [Polyangiaceae bacterium]